MSGEGRCKEAIENVPTPTTAMRIQTFNHRNNDNVLPKDEDDYIDPHFGEIPPKFDVLQEEEGIYSQALRYILKQEKICHVLRGLPRFQ